MDAIFWLNELSIKDEFLLLMLGIVFIVVLIMSITLLLEKRKGILQLTHTFTPEFLRCHGGKFRVEKTTIPGTAQLNMFTYVIQKWEADETWGEACLLQSTFELPEIFWIRSIHERDGNIRYYVSIDDFDWEFDVGGILQIK